MHDSSLDLHNMPIGPQHPSLKEPAFIKLELEGSYVKKVELNLGYVHRGIEYLMQGKTLDKGLFTAERVCGFCSMSHVSTYTRAAESLLGVETTLKVKVERTILLELERLHSHFAWLGVLMHEIGLETLFMFTFKEREKILDLFDELTGNRIHHGLNFIGTVKYDFSPKLEKLSNVMNALEKDMTEFRKTVQKNNVISFRLKKTGHISKQQALSFGLVGPVARASGVKHDLRHDDEIEAYGKVNFDVITDTQGDAFTRTMCRVKEVFESVKIIRQLIKNFPDEKIPEKQA